MRSIESGTLPPQEQETICIIYFYGNGCPIVDIITPYIDELESQYSLEVHRYEVYNNVTNAELAIQFFEEHGIPPASRGIPVVIIGNTLLLGQPEIENSLENIILSQTGGLICPIPGEPTGPPSFPDLLGLLIVVTSAGLIDSINPCALAILIFLLNTLIGSGDKRRALKAGLAFSLSLYIAYFLFGLGLFSAIQIAGISLIQMVAPNRKGLSNGLLMGSLGVGSVLGPVGAPHQLPVAICCKNPLL